MPLHREKIEKFLKESVIVRTFGVLDSTNNEAKRRAAAEPAGAVLYAAERQTAGRGRRGHSFYSPPTGLYMTLSLPMSGEPETVQRLTCAAAVAVCDAIRELSGLSPAVKWVNDILLNGKKVAGILAELVLDDANRPQRVIIGVGVNLTTDDFPADCAATAGSVGGLDPDRLCAAVADNLIAEYRNLYDNSFLEKYKRLNLCLGQTVAYSDRDGTHTARAVDIAPDGSLIVTENGTKKSLHSGEISVKSLPLE